jgi:alkaline phosphatase
MKHFRIFVLLVAVFSFLSISSCQPQQKEQKARYVFLFIGDGMGISQVTTAEVFQAEIKDEQYRPLGFSKFPHTGFSTTYAANRFITGSAASGTALATGHKTNIGRISMDANADSALLTIAEKAKQEGMKVGIISSVSIDHATPAVFYAHQESRNMYHEISLDLAASDFDFFGGGGFKEPAREDVNVVEMAKENGFNYINDEESFRKLKPADEKVLFVNPELTNGSAMLYAIDQPEGYITLAEITQKAIEYLDNENGFFMMIEGGKIDWLCHANDAGAMVHEVIDFAEAVDVAVEFYQQHPEETLIVVTADHETGGLGVGSEMMKYDTDYTLLQNQKMSGEEFNKYIAEWRKENHLNDKGFKKMLMALEENFGVGGEGAPIELTPKEIEAFKKTFMGLDLSQEWDYGDYSPLTVLSTKTLSNHSGLGWTSKSHTGVSVPVYALGVNGEAFSAYTDNTDIPKIIWETIK